MPPQNVGDAGVGQGEIWIEFDGFLIHGESVFELALAQIIASAEIKVVGLRIGSGLLSDDFFFLRGKLDFESFGDAERDFFLNGEDVFHLAVVAFGPDGMAGFTFDELGGDTEAIAGAADGTFQDVHCAEFFADLRRGDGLIAKLQHFGTRKNFETGDFGKFGDDIFGHAIAKIFIFFGSTKIFEIEHGDGFLFGNWRGDWRRRSGGERRFNSSGGRVGARRGVEVTLQTFEIGAEFGSGLAAIIAIFLEGFANNAVQIWGKFGIPFGDGFGSGVEDLIEDDGGGVSLEWKRTGRHFIENYAEGKEIGAGVESFAASLFGRHVGDGAEGAARTG
jgi:hypothetical protein